MQCPEKAGGACSPEVDDSPAMKKIIEALDQEGDAIKNVPPGYFFALTTEIKLFQSDVTQAEQSITEEISRITEERTRFSQKQSINSKFIE